MTPNYFRFVKQDSSGGDSYDGYTLRHDDTFEGRTDWKMGTLAAPVYSEAVSYTHLTLPTKA